MSIKTKAIALLREHDIIVGHKADRNTRRIMRVKATKPNNLIQWLQIRSLYNNAFPAAEKKPFSMIRTMYRKKKTDIWYCELDGRFAGLVITINGPEQILIDYLAICKKSRGKGIGSEILSLMRAQYEGKGIFLEIERVFENADNEEEKIRRKQFYLRNGMQEMHTYVKLFGVEMELLGYECTLDFSQYQSFYRENYNEWAASHIEPGRE